MKHFTLSLVAGIVFTLVLSLGGNLLYDFFIEKPKEKETIQMRIQKLTKSLKDTTDLIGQIESEIQSRSALAEKLKSDVDHYKQLREISLPEVEAIAQVFRAELKTEGKKSLWIGIAINLFFFALGVVTPFAINKFT